ncbi:mitochondrial import receptor subunit Tom22-domain-containing protein [Kalaharituber pfeilii]|nr:mitochondrial import receptor subunit Tom22-domain-containing protein [Kalaharituber pfeilii]
MVKLAEVTDEHFEEVQEGQIPSDNDDDFEDYSDSDSEAGDRMHHLHHGRSPRAQQQHYSEKGRFASVADEESDSDDDDDDDSTLEETIAERLAALKDMIPIKQRTKISNTAKGIWGWLTWGGRTGGTIAYVLSTGVLMLGVPYALAVAEEGQMMEMEREMKLQQQANELITPGGQSQQQQGLKI